MNSRLQNLVDSFDLGGCRVSILPSTSTLEMQQIDFHAAEWTQSQAIKSEGRRDEYLRTRSLLHHLFGSHHDFSRGPQGFVRWPDGWTGSISHSQGHVAVVLCRSTEVLGVGLDLERVDRVRSELNKKICSAQEWDNLNTNRPEAAQSLLLARVFAAKEALYKAVFPSGLRQFWFEDAEMIHLSDQLDSGKLKLLIDAAPGAMHGKIFDIQFIDKKFSDQDFVIAICKFHIDSN